MATVNTNRKEGQNESGAERGVEGGATNPFANFKQFSDPGQIFKSYQNNYTSKMSEATSYLNNALDAMAVNSDAAFKCANIASRAMEGATSQVQSFTNELLTKSFDLVNKSFNCSNLHDYSDLQERWFDLCSKGAMNNYVELTNIAVNCANDIQKPLQNCYNQTLNLVTPKKS